MDHSNAQLAQKLIEAETRAARFPKIFMFAFLHNGNSTFRNLKYKPTFVPSSQHLNNLKVVRAATGNFFV